MAGLYDWILNSLNTEQSPATNQLPKPLANQNTSSNTNPAANVGTMSASDPLRTFMIQKYLATLSPGSDATKQQPTAPIATYAGRPASQNTLMPMLTEQDQAANLRLNYLMSQLGGNNSTNGNTGY